MDQQFMLAKSQNIFPQQELQEKIQKSIEQALQQGADAVDAVIYVESGFAINVRKGQVETLEHHQSKGLEITVYKSHRTGTASTSDLSTNAISATVSKAHAIAAFTEEDLCNGLADENLLAYHYPDLKLYHHWDITPAEAIDMAIECEKIALAQDRHIIESEGVAISTYDSYKIYANSAKFIGSYAASLHSITCGLVAESHNKMQRDHEYTISRRPELLDDLAFIAKQAAQKTVKRLNARNLSTRRCPVVFHASVAKSLLNHFVAAISGRNIYQQTSFLVDSMGKEIFPNHIRINQQPHLLSGIGSAAFDSEGVTTKTQDYVFRGILTSYALSSYSARKLNMQTTGNAGGIFNLTISHNDFDFTDLLKKMGTGLLVTDLLGQGVNILTGTYSRGAAGFWVENGYIVYPVEEITIASQLPVMFKNIIAIANDVDCRSNIKTGSILIEEMMVAGK